MKSKARLGKKKGRGKTPCLEFTYLEVLFAQAPAAEGRQSREGQAETDQAVTT